MLAMFSDTSRRSLVIGAAALPALAVPAVAATESDEIYAMIEAHRRAYDVYIETIQMRYRKPRSYRKRQLRRAVESADCYGTW
jgi:hypothetical protein